MKKNILFFLLGFVWAHGIAQIKPNELKPETIDVSEICFGGVCVGDSLSRMYKLLGKPDSVYIEKKVGEENPNDILISKFYIYGLNRINERQKFNILIKEIFSYNGEKTTYTGWVYNMFCNSEKYVFGKMRYKIPIGSDTTVFKKYFPIAFEIGKKMNESIDRNIINRRKEKKIELEKLRQSERYSLDKKFRLAVDKQTSDFKASRLPSKDNISFCIYLNSHEPFIGSCVSFQYEKGKLSSIMIVDNQEGG